MAAEGRQYREAVLAGKVKCSGEVCFWGSFVWNMFDFSSVRRNEGGQKFINAKGLVSHDRQVRKDAFYYI